MHTARFLGRPLCVGRFACARSTRWIFCERCKWFTSCLLQTRRLHVHSWRSVRRSVDFSCSSQVGRSPAHRRSLAARCSLPARYSLPSGRPLPARTAAGGQQPARCSPAHGPKPPICPRGKNESMRPGPPSCGPVAPPRRGGQPGGATKILSLPCVPRDGRLK